MLKKLKSIYEKIKYFLSKEKCYADREREGLAVFGCCCGLYGGDKETGFVNYDCIDCKYLTK